MTSTLGQTWLVRGVTMLTWAGFAGSGVYWSLKLLGAGQPVHGDQLAPTVQASQGMQQVDPAVGLGRLFTGTGKPADDSKTPAVNARFSLTGVVRKASGNDMAIVSVDAKPARPFRVGAELAPGWVLQKVTARDVSIGSAVDGPALVRLELPLRRPDSTP